MESLNSSEIGLLSSSTKPYYRGPGLLQQDTTNVDDLLSEKVTKEITCNPCGRQYRYGVRTPRILPCLHTSCERCLRTKLQKEDHEQDTEVVREEDGAGNREEEPTGGGMAQVTCPICRREFDVPAQDISRLPVNFYAAKLLELIDYFRLERKSKLPCIGCVEPAHWRCVECDENYCQDHRDFHQKSRATCDHKVLTFRQILMSPRSLSTMRNQYCSSHTNKPLEIYCKDCNRAICTMCAVTQHKNHETKEVTEAVAELKAKVDTLRPRISMNMYSLKQALTKVRTTAREVNVDAQVSSRKIGGLIEACIAAVREKEKELTSEVEKKRRLNTEIINSQKELLEGELTSMLTGKEFIEKAFIGSETEVLCLEPQIVAKMDELISGDEPKISSDVDRLTFASSGHENIFRAIESLGRVGPSQPERGPRMMVDEKGDLVLLDNHGNIIRGETKELLVLLRKNILEEEMRQEEELKRKMEEEAARLKALEPPKTPTPLPPRDFTLPLSSSRSFGQQGMEPGMFNGPVGMCHNDKGYLVVCDVHNNRIQVVRPDGTYVLGFGVTGTGVGELNGPNDVAIFGGRNFLVADTYNDRVQLFAPTGRFIRTIGQKARRRAMFIQNISGATKKSDAMEGLFDKPFGVCVNSKSQILVSDMGNHRIQVFEKNGEFSRQIGSKGRDPGFFMYPYGIAVDPDDNIFVCDLGNSRIQKFSPEGRFLRVFGEKGEGPGEFLQPRSLAVDPKTGCVAVVDTALHKVQIFTNEGKYINKFGSRGKEEGKFTSPCGVAADADGNIYVSDFRNHRIHVI